MKLEELILTQISVTSVLSQSIVYLWSKISEDKKMCMVAHCLLFSQDKPQVIGSLAELVPVL